MNNCFSKTIDSCFKELSSSPNGLSKEEAFLREGRYKSERLETQKKEGFIKKFFKQFADLMIIILLLAATVSLIIGLISSSTSELFDALIIMAIVFMNAMFGAIQENKAEKSIRDPRCRLEQPFFGVSYAPPKNAQKINNACEFLKSNVAYRLAIAQKTKANAGKEPPEGMGLVDALENGFIEQALNRRPPLSSAVCLKEEKDGVSLLSAAIRAERLDTLFSSKNWNNAKEFAAAWDHVPPEHRWQLDGKDGRPSFPKIKNEVMKKAVLSAVRKNNVRN